MFLTFNPFAASKVFEFKDPDTGYQYKASSKAELVKQIVSYRSQNELPEIEELKLILDTYLCNLPINAGSCHSVTNLKRGLLAYAKGGIALVKNLWYNKTVSLEVADERGAICVGCVLNIFPDRGPFVKWSDDIAEASVGDKRSKYHNELGTCEGCGCPLRAKVFYPGPMNLTRKEKILMEEKSLGKCWQVK